MKTIYALTALLSLTFTALGADVKFSALPTASSPSTNSYLPIIDLDLAPANQNAKYLLTNLATVAQIPTVPTMIVSNNVASAGLLSVDASKTNGITATSNHVITALGYSPVSKAGGIDNTGTLYFPWFVSGSYQQYADSNTQSTATITLDFNSTNYHVIVLTGAVTIASSNLGTNRNWSGEFWNTQSTNCAVTWPSWRFVGGKTTTIDPAQTLRLFARVPLFANDTNVIAVSSQTQ